MARKAPATIDSSIASGLGELWGRLRFVLIAIIIYRIGTHIPVPGINPEQMAALFQAAQGTILEMLNMFSGGALERMSIFTLNLIPYISASIIIQLMSAVNPTLAQLRKEGEQGRRQITQYTRYGTVLLATVQASGIAVGLSTQGLAINPGPSFIFVAVVSMVTGAIFLMWLGEQVTERGIGNGISLLIFASIVAGLPSAIGQSFEQARQGDLNILLLLLIAIFAIAVIAIVVFIERGQRRITVNYARRQVGRQQMAAQASHLPLKINMAGVIPAIFASSILLFPATMTQWFGPGEGPGWLQDVTLALGPGQPLYLVLFSLFIVFFCFFYTALMFNPRDMAENLKRTGAFIPGIRPGEQSALYIDNVMTRLTVFGSIYITAVCLLPLFLINAANVSFYLGGTSLLIVVVVVMDFMAQIQAHLMSHQYESVMRKANLKGFGSSARVR